jgi:hypothetical protein
VALVNAKDRLIPGIADRNFFTELESGDVLQFQIGRLPHFVFPYRLKRLLYELDPFLAWQNLGSFEVRKLVLKLIQLASRILLGHVSRTSDRKQCAVLGWHG